MCKFYSCIITKPGKVLGDGQTDSHEDIIKEHKLDDSKPLELRTWIRVEIMPHAYDKTIKDVSKWVIKVDEDNTPDWYNKKHEDLLRDQVKSLFNKILFVGKKGLVFKSGRQILIDCESKHYGNSTSKHYSNSTSEHYGNSTSKHYESSTSKHYHNSHCIKYSVAATCKFPKKSKTVAYIDWSGSKPKVSLK